MTSRVIAAAALAALFALSSTDALGQQMSSGGRSYRPAAGGPISPYMNYFRNDRVGPLGNYNGFVRPTIQLQSTLQQQNQFLLQQQQELSLLNSEFQQGAVQEPIAPTGTAGRFMDLQGRFAYPPRR